MKSSLAHVAVLLSVVGLVGCGESATSRDTTAGTAVSFAAETSTSVPPSTVSASTSTSTSTSTPASTTSTTATPTSVSQVPSGWVDVAAMPTEAFPPCCASTWQGTPSPSLSADSEPVADGIYHASRVEWSPENPSTLVIALRRFEACGLLPVGSCEPPPAGEPYLEGQLGIAGVPERQMTITLDGTVKVGVGGWDSALVKRQGNGADLVALMVELDRAYNEVLAAPLLAGGDPDAIIDGLLANPAEGFGPPPVDYFRTLLYSYDGAPPLLFEPPFDYTDGGGRVPRDGTSVLYMTAIQFDHGSVSLFFYGGYYP